MAICIRCQRRTRDLVPNRRHCRRCQREAEQRRYQRRRLVIMEQKSRARATRYGCQVEIVDYAAIYAAQQAEPCGMCGQSFSAASNIEFDHIVPLASGGAHAAANIRLLHRRCNREASIRIFALRALR